jgi:hypothetical protein
LGLTSRATGERRSKDAAKGVLQALISKEEGHRKPVMLPEWVFVVKREAKRKLILEQMDEVQRMLVASEKPDDEREAVPLRAIDGPEVTE